MPSQTTPTDDDQLAACTRPFLEDWFRRLAETGFDGGVLPAFYLVRRARGDGAESLPVRLAGRGPRGSVRHRVLLARQMNAGRIVGSA